MVRRCVIFVLGMLLLVGQEARAQSTGAALAALLVGGSGQGEGALTQDQAAALRAVLLSEASTFPLSSSAGGFTWMFDPTLGVQTRRSQSFGPMFAERAMTTGRHKLNVGLAYQHTSFNSVAGQKLNALSVTLTGFGYVDTFATSLAVSIDRVNINASYGITDKVDVGLIVPFGATRASGSSTFTESLNGVLPPACPPSKCFPTVSSSASGSSSGIGDVILRGKAALPSLNLLDLGVGLDLRLPTGSTDKLLGTGTAQAKLMLIGAVRNNRVAPHFNVGYTFGGKGVTVTPQTNDFATLGANPDVSPEFDYTFGADIVASPMVTIMGDVIGRSLRNSVKIDYGTKVFPTFPSTTFNTFDLTGGTVNLLLGTIGAKVRVGGEWLFNFCVLFPLNDNGVKPNVTPVVGFERAF